MTYGAVLVTGATGFIGSALCPFLAARGRKVRAAVRGDPLPVAGAVEVVRVGDLHERTDWSKALADVDTVVHLAARAHRVGREALDEEPYDRINHRATGRLAEQVLASGVRRLVFVSSVAAGAGPVGRSPPEGAMDTPRTPYGRSKLAAERAIAATLAEGLPDWCVLRPPLVYGPGNPGNMQRLLRMMRVFPVLPLGGIRNRRSFVFIDNLLHAVETVLDAPGASRRTFHVSDDETISTPDLVRLLSSAAGRRVRLPVVPERVLAAAARIGDALRAAGLPTPLDTPALDRLRESLVVDNDALKQATGWRPPVRLADGLRATVVPAL